MIKISHVTESHEPRIRGKILKCSDPLAWYAGRVGEIISVERTDNYGHWGREGGDFNCINYIKHHDMELLPNTYEPGESVWCIFKWMESHYRPIGRIICKVDERTYRISFIVPIMMKEPSTADFDIDWISKHIDSEKWA
jgi:uncharacterized protein YbaR (Trm112 family)